MIITITCRHLEVTPAIREYAEAKAAKILKYYDLIKDVEVILDGGESKHKRVEIIVNAEHHNMFVGTQTGDDLYACIDQAAHKIERQITEHKDRFRNRKHPG